jgi:hypothetical protein
MRYSSWDWLPVGLAAPHFMALVALVVLSRRCRGRPQIAAGLAYTVSVSWSVKVIKSPHALGVSGGGDGALSSVKY